MWVHPKRAAVVDDERACFDRIRRVLFAHNSSGGEQRYLDVCEAVMGQFLDGMRFALEIERLADRALGSEQAKPRYGEVPLLEQLNNLSADQPGRTDNGYVLELHITFQLFLQ